MLKSALLNAVEAQRENVVQHRRHLHLHPEPSFGESKTSAYVANALRAMGIAFSDGWCANHGAAGIVAKVEGLERAHAPWRCAPTWMPCPFKRSTVRTQAPYLDGCTLADTMPTQPACSARLRPCKLRGTSGPALYIVSSSQEKRTFPEEPPFWCKKAPSSLTLPLQAPLRASGPLVDGIVGQHVYPQLDAGTVGFRSGAYMAAADELRIRVVGKGGHAALPHRTVDPIVAAAHVITALQTVVSRSCDPTQPSVLTIGKIRGGHARNVIPDEVILDGTLRTYDLATAETLRSSIKRVAESTAQAFGAVAEVDLAIGYPQ